MDALPHRHEPCSNPHGKTCIVNFALEDCDIGSESASLKEFKININGLAWPSSILCTMDLQYYGVWKGDDAATYSGGTSPVMGDEQHGDAGFFLKRF